MNLLEFLDRRHERQMQNPRRPRDIRQFIGFAFLVGYYAVVMQFFRDRPLPPENAQLIRDGLLVLGPAVGLIVGAMFRSDARDEQQTANTSEAFRAVRAVANSSGTGATEPNALRVGDHVELNRTEDTPL